MPLTNCFRSRQVRLNWRSGRPFGFDTVVETISEAYMATGYQLEEVQNVSRLTVDTAGAAYSRPLPMMVPRTSTSTVFPSGPMPTPQANPMSTPAAVPISIQLPSFEKNYTPTLANVETTSSIATMVEKLGAATTVANKDTWPATVKTLTAISRKRTSRV